LGYQKLALMHHLSIAEERWGQRRNLRLGLRSRWGKSDLKMTGHCDAQRRSQLQCILWVLIQLRPAVLGYRWM
jgi:hypothetical protein